MNLEDFFNAEITDSLLERIDKLNESLKPRWGIMSAEQMLAHCNVTFELVYEDNHPKPKGFTKLLLMLFVKNIVVGKAAYKKNSRTSDAFLITTKKVFDDERLRLVDYIKKTQLLGEDYFDGRLSHSLGKLSKEEWSIMFYKHLDHHLNQFGV